MLNNLKARILKYCEMGWKELALLKRWMKHSTTFNTFDPEAFSSPSLRVAVGTNEQGDPIVFCPIESVLMVSAYAVSPSLSPAEAQRAGDVLDAAIAREAQRAGVSKLLLVLPKDYPVLPDSEWREVRVYERQIAQPLAMSGVDCSSTSAVNKFLN